MSAIRIGLLLSLAAIISSAELHGSSLVKSFFVPIVLSSTGVGGRIILPNSLSQTVRLKKSQWNLPTQPLLAKAAA